MIRLLYFLFLPILWVPSFAWATGDPFIRYTPSQNFSEESAEVVETLASFTDQILKLKPSPNTFYIAVGNSPLPLAADLESRLGAERVIRLPLSSLDQILGDRFSNPENDLLMDLLLDHFLSPVIQHPSFQMVVIDYGRRGGSLRGMRVLIQRYLEKRGLQKDQAKFAILARRSTFPEHSSADLFLSLSPDMDDHFFKRRFSYLRQFERFTVLQWTAWLKSQKPTGENHIRQLIQTKLNELSVSNGKENYQLAVQRFRNTTRDSWAARILRQCATFLLDLSSD